MMNGADNHSELTADDLDNLFQQHGHGFTPAQLAQTRVPLGALYVVPGVFQPRNMGERPWEKERHIGTLAAAAKQQRTLDHITVFPIAGKRYVIDGHCRLEAYRAAGWKDNRMVPVSHLQGSFADALMESAGANSKDKLPLTTEEKTEAAWRLVLFDEARGCFSIREIERKSGASKSVVHNMKKTLEEDLDFDPRTLTWAGVKKEKRGVRDHNEDWQEQQARVWAERLRKAFGEKPNIQPEIFLRAVEMAYPRALDTAIDEVAGERVQERIDEKAESDF